MIMNVVVLLAGGVGTRISSSLAKQHIYVSNHQIIEYTLQAFSQSKNVDEIVIISNKDYIEENEKYKDSFPKLTSVIHGGDTRIMSTYNAVQYLVKGHNLDDKILISDAVRPIITKDEIIELFASLENNDAVTTAVEVYETILKVDDNWRLQKIVPRNGVLRQTSPEGYRLSGLVDLYLNTERNTIQTYRNIGIDQMFEQGKKIGIVRSTPLNFKITTKEDLFFFEAVLKQGFSVLTSAKT